MDGKTNELRDILNKAEPELKALLDKLKLEPGDLPDIDLSALPELDLSAIPELDLSAIPELDLSAIPELDLSTIPGLDEQTDGLDPLPADAADLR